MSHHPPTLHPPLSTCVLRDLKSLPQWLLIIAWPSCTSLKWLNLLTDVNTCEIDSTFGSCKFPYQFLPLSFISALVLSVYFRVSFAHVFLMLMTFKLLCQMLSVNKSTPSHHRKILKSYHQWWFYSQWHGCFLSRLTSGYLQNGVLVMSGLALFDSARQGMGGWRRSKDSDQIVMLDIYVGVPKI